MTRWKVAIALLILFPCLSEAAHFRKYEERVTKEEREHVSFIVRSLGFKSLPKIWSEKSALKHAGDKVDHLHPLRFLMCVFTDEEMKAAISNLKGRIFTWSEFKKGLYESLTSETDNGNMPTAYIEDFSKKIGIDSRLIHRPLQQKRWDEFMGLLIKHVPRSGDPKRYDM